MGRSSRFRVRSSGCASCAAAMRTTPSCSRRPTRRSRTGRRCPWPRRAGARAARVAGAHVVLLGGSAALYVERGGRTLVPLREPEDAWLGPALHALADWVRDGHAKRLAVERFDGRPVAETEAMPLLVEAGFLAGPAPGRAAAPRLLDRDEQPEHDAEEQVAEGRLREGAAGVGERRQLGRTAGRMERSASSVSGYVRGARRARRGSRARMRSRRSRS